MRRALLILLAVAALACSHWGAYRAGEVEGRKDGLVDGILTAWLEGHEAGFQEGFSACPCRTN